MKKYSMMNFPKSKFFPPKQTNLRCVPELFVMVYDYLGKLGMKEMIRMMNLSFSIPLEGPLDSLRLEKSLQDLFRDEPILRTYISKEKGGYYLVEKDNYEFHLPVYEVEGRNRIDKLAKVKEMLVEDAKNDLRYFDPDYEQTQFKLLKLDENYHVLMFLGSHIYYDFGAFTSLISRLMRYYNGTETPGKRLATFGDFIEEETAFLKSPAGQKELQYWKDEFSDYTRHRLRKDKKSSADWKEEDSIAFFENDWLESIAAQNKTSVFNTMMLAVQMGYAKAVGDADSAANYVISNRSEEKYRNTAGMLMRILSSRLVMKDDMTIADLQKYMRKKIGEGYLNHHAAADMVCDLPLLIIDESMGDIAGDLLFNGKPIDLQADLNVEAIMQLCQKDTIMVMIMPAGDKRSVNLVGNTKKYGHYYKSIRDNICLALRFMDRYPDKTFGEFMRSDVTLETVDLIEDPEQIELIAI